MPPVVIGLAAVGAAVGGAAVGVGVGAAVLGASVIATGIGTVLSVVGMVTKNKLVSQLGMGFGIAGAVGGLGATAAVGGLFGQGVASSALAPLEASTAANTLTSAVGTASVAAEGAKLGGGSTLAGTVGGQANVAQPLLSAPPVTGSFSAAAAPVATTGRLALPATDFAASGANLGSSLSTLNPTTGLLSSPTLGQAARLGVPTVDFGTNGANLGSTLTQLQNAPTSGLAQIFANLEPGAKSALLMAGGQAVAGGVGGIFSGMSADKQLALQQLIDQENRSQFNRQMERATSSPGLIQFARPQTPMAPVVPNPSIPVAPIAQGV